VKLALVTGGLRRLGAAIAGRLAGDGYALALHARDSTEPDAELAGTLERHGTRWAAFAADLSRPTDVEALLPAVEKAFGKAPDVLVNNAALFAEDDWRSATIEAMVAHYAVNAAAGARLACALAERLGPERRAVVVNIADQRVAGPHGDQLSYTLSKQAAAAATRTLARALAPRVRVCAVAPGLTMPTADYDAPQVERLAARMPLGALPRPSDVADAVLYLIGAQATTGQVLFVDGGAWLESFERDFVYLET
jgi:NAD(P)-dependent dehydrogenase (short-subunit alcohol dehydrogenase family)